MTLSLWERAAAREAREIRRSQNEFGNRTQKAQKNFVPFVCPFVLLMPRFLFFCEGFRKKNKKRGISSSLRALPSLQPTYAASLFNCSNVIC